MVPGLVRPMGRTTVKKHYHQTQQICYGLKISPGFFKNEKLSVSRYIQVGLFSLPKARY
jgi:hypothetical protein